MTETALGRRSWFLHTRCYVCAMYVVCMCTPRGTSAEEIISGMLCRGTTKRRHQEVYAAGSRVNKPDDIRSLGAKTTPACVRAWLAIVANKNKQEDAPGELYKQHFCSSRAAAAANSWPLAYRQMHTRRCVFLTVQCPECAYFLRQTYTGRETFGSPWFKRAQNTSPRGKKRTKKKHGARVVINAFLATFLAINVCNQVAHYFKAVSKWG